MPTACRLSQTLDVMIAATPTTVIFDVDGTLVDSDGFEENCYAAAVRAVLGDIDFSTKWETYRHVTDAGILHEILQIHGIHDDGSVRASVREAFGTEVKAYLDGGGLCAPIVGARQVFDQLGSRGLRVGLATGGWGHTAAMKLTHAGVDISGLAFASCDDAMERIEITRSCMNKLGARAEETIYIGDGPWDVEASAEIGVAFVGVGERLKGRLHKWLPDLRELVERI